jgi:hypothetical protein
MFSKRFALFPAMALTIAGCVQNTKELPSSAPVAQSPSNVQSASALDLPIEKIADSTSGCTVLDRDFPGLREHPMYPYFKSMTLNQIAALSHGQITQEMLAKARTDFSASNNTARTSAAARVP